VPALRIIARDPGSAARAGVVDTPHGPIETPAFVPLATKASVRGLTSQEVSGLGYEMVLGNTFHLFLNPGHELIARLGGLHRFMGWRGPIITDSGGFQVFSMGHGTVADEIKGRRAGGREGAILAIEEDGVRFRSYVDGDVRFMGPETSMEVQEGLGSDIVVAFDECTPFNVDREYTAASTERTHRWLDRCIRWRDQHARTDSLFYGIVQGGVYEDLRRSSTEAVVASGCEGVAIGGSLGSEKAQMYEVVGWSTQELDRLAPDRPRHLLGIGDVDDRGSVGFGLAGQRIDRIGNVVGAAVMSDIGDVTIALVVDGRLIGAAPLQIVIADQFHVGGFGRSPDHLLLRMDTAAGGESNRNQRGDKSPALHPVPPQMFKANSSLTEHQDTTRKGFANTRS